MTIAVGDEIVLGDGVLVEFRGHCGLVIGLRDDGGGAEVHVEMLSGKRHWFYASDVRQRLAAVAS